MKRFIGLWRSHLRMFRIVFHRIDDLRLRDRGLTDYSSPQNAASLAVMRNFEIGLANLYRIFTFPLFKFLHSSAIFHLTPVIEKVSVW